MGGKRSEERNCNQMVLEAIYKINEIIIHSRFGEPSSPASTSPEHQRFNLDVPAIAELRQQAGFLSSNLHQSFSIHIRHEPSGAVLEKWAIGFNALAEAEAAESGVARMKLRQTYLQLMVFLRSCCSLCLLLPLARISSHLLSYHLVLPSSSAAQGMHALESMLDYKLHEFKPVLALTGSLTVSVGYISDYSAILAAAPPIPPHLHDTELESDFVFAHSPPLSESKLADHESTKKPKSALTKMLQEHREQESARSDAGPKEPVAEKAELVRAVVSAVEALPALKQGEEEGVELSRATSHPRAIPIRKKNSSVVYTKTRSSPMRESSTVEEFSPDDAAHLFAFPSSVTRPQSLPIGANLSQASSMHAGQLHGLGRSKRLSRSIHDADPRGHRPGSLPLLHPLRARAMDTFPFKQPRGSSRSFHLYDHANRPSSSLLSDKSVKMVTLPSGTIYRSPSGSSLADLISRSSLTSQQLGPAANSFDPTTPPFVVYSKSGTEAASPPLQLSNSASSSPGMLPRTLAMAVHNTANPFIQGPAQAHRTLVSTSMPRSITASASNSSSRLSIQPFKQREPPKQPKRHPAGHTGLLAQEMTSSGSRRRVSLSNVPASNPWIVSRDEIDTLITHLKDREGELCAVYEDAEPQPDLDLPFAMPSSADDLGTMKHRHSTADSDLAFFMSMLKEPPELRSIGVHRGKRQSTTK